MVTSINHRAKQSMSNTLIYGTRRNFIRGRIISVDPIRPLRKPIATCRAVLQFSTPHKVINNKP
jgi:hypothetical protein